jgi:hypothetical protein
MQAHASATRFAAATTPCTRAIMSAVLSRCTGGYEFHDDVAAEGRNDDEEET